MNRVEFNNQRLYTDDNQIEVLLKNFSLELIKEVLDDIYNCGGFGECYKYYEIPETNIDKILCLKKIDWFAMMDFALDLWDNVDYRIYDINEKLKESEEN